MLGALSANAIQYGVHNNRCSGSSQVAFLSHAAITQLYSKSQGLLLRHFAVCNVLIKYSEPGHHV